MIKIRKEYQKTIGQIALRAIRRKTILVLPVLTSPSQIKSQIFKAFIV